MPENDGTPSNYAAHVRAQYEAYPFPRRDPSDESRRLVVAEQECLGKLNHFCFGGRQTFGNGFRVLVAGGGTGDHTIFLAEQLRDYDAQIVYIDISGASMDIARQRARVRGLDNIEWHHGSILDIESLDAGSFDLISCTGVLHHLPDPAHGLEALRAVLAPDGAMSLMLYGRMGRLPVYAGQELMQLVNAGIEDRSLKTRYARSVLKSLPDTNWLLRGADAERIRQQLINDESDLNDVLLHEQDRAYSVPEIYEFLAGAGLELIEFTSFLGDPPCFRYFYNPLAWIEDPALGTHVAGLSRPRQQAIAEAMHCRLTCHGFYAAPSAAQRIAHPGVADMVPYFLYFDPGNLAEHFRNAAGRECGLTYRHSTVHFPVGRYSADLIAGIDGSSTIAELFEVTRRARGEDIPEGVLRQDFMAFYGPLNDFDILLLRHRDVAPFREYPLEIVT